MNIIPTDSRYSIVDYLQPWKLALLIVGSGLLIYGAKTFSFADWDVPFSLIMALVSYVTAPWVVRTLWQRESWVHVVAAIGVAAFATAGLYALYWLAVNPEIFVSFYGQAIPEIVGLYVICGLVWLHQGSLSTLVKSRR